MPTNQQHREAEKRRLQRQLEERRARESARKRFTLIASIVGTLVVIAGVVIGIAVSTGGSSKNQAGGEHDTVSSPPTASTVSFEGVTVTGATNLKAAPKVTAKGTAQPSTLQYRDLVVGKGKAATATSTASVQYVGALYKDGTVFDSSWAKGAKPVKFTLNQVVPGFAQGIGGAGKIPPMHVGGRRIMILPPSLGYGAQAQGPIPANSTLVFVVDLTSVTG